MIDEIQVENLALIREATLVPARGLTVLTGETGAGKTALLSALKLLMGARADKDAVRDGEEAGRRRSRRAGRHAPRILGRAFARVHRRPHGQRRRAGSRHCSHHRLVRSARAPAAHENVPTCSYARCLGGRRGGTGAHRLRGGVRDGERGGGRADARARGGRGVLGQARRGALRAAAHRRGGSARGRVRRAAGRPRPRGAC